MLRNPELLKAEQIELLVDTESTYTWVLNATLESLGVEAKTVRKFKTIDGKLLLERKVGEVFIEYLDEKATRMVVLAEEGNAEALGVGALEVAPITKRLEKAEVLLAL